MAPAKGAMAADRRYRQIVMLCELWQRMLRLLLPPPPPFSLVIP